MGHKELKLSAMECLLDEQVEFHRYNVLVLFLNLS